jgi:hypothetical protein
MTKAERDARIAALEAESEALKREAEQLERALRAKSGRAKNAARDQTNDPPVAGITRPK